MNSKKKSDKYVKHLHHANRCSDSVADSDAKKIPILSQSTQLDLPTSYQNKKPIAINILLEAFLHREETFFQQTMCSWNSFMTVNCLVRKKITDVWLYLARLVQLLLCGSYIPK